MNKLQSLHAFRGIFAILIFLHHYCLYGTTQYIGGGNCSVSFFFILSGFAISAGYQKKFLDGSTGISAKDFIWKRIKKIYPLHLFCWLLWLMWTCLILAGDFMPTSFEDVKLCGCNLLLLQSWVPNHSWYFSCNGVSWYLSSLLFCYIAYPALVKVIPLVRRQRRIAVCLLLAITILYTTIVLFIPEATVNAIVYICPAIRVIDFIIGMLLWNLLLHIRKCSYAEVGVKAACAMQLVALIIMILFFVNYVFCGFPERFGLASYWWLPCILLIMTFATLDNHDTAVNRFLRIRCVQKFADLSFSFFMIHQLYIRFWKHVFGVTGIGGSYELTFLFVLISCAGLAWGVHRYIESGVDRLIANKFVLRRGGVNCNRVDCVYF